MPVQHIRFATHAVPGEAEIVRFRDPSPSVAVSASSASDFALNLLAEDATEAVSTEETRTYIKVRGAELAWSPARATLRCDPVHAHSLIAEIVAFTHYERALRAIEADIANAWEELDQDRPIAFEATPASLKRSGQISDRMMRTFTRRAALARLEPHLYAPGADTSVLARKVGEELRDKTATETRLEIADGQMEVFEHIYEMASQRMGEFRASHSEHLLEWIIIVLLAVETLVMLVRR